MYKFMSKFDNGSISLPDIQSAMDSKEYKAVKDKFEFKTYKNEFLVSDMIGTNPIFYHMSNFGSYYEDIEFKYSNREIKLFTLTSYNKIDSDMLGDKKYYLSDDVYLMTIAHDDPLDNMIYKTNILLGLDDTNSNSQLKAVQVKYNIEDEYGEDVLIDIHLKELCIDFK